MQSKEAEPLRDIESDYMLTLAPAEIAERMGVTDIENSLKGSKRNCLQICNVCHICKSTVKTIDISESE